MKKTLYVRPAQGLTIPDPATGKHLPGFGDAVDDSQYWRRRLRERSVEETSKEAVARGRAEAEKARLAASAGAPVAVGQATETAASAKKGGK